MQQPDESRLWKYLSLPHIFEQKAAEIDLTCKQHLRICERLAAHLARQKPTLPKDFEQTEYLKDFVLKSAQLNEKTIQLLDYLKNTVQEITNDAKAFTEGARLNAIIRDQGERIIQQAIKEIDTLERKIDGKTIC